LPVHLRLSWADMHSHEERAETLRGLAEEAMRR
jgi:hypothetical protein